MRHATADPPLYHPTTDLAEQTWRACANAREAIRVAAELVRTCRTMKEEREHWRVVLADRIAHPDHFMARCVYCSRMRTQTHEWVVIPAPIGHMLQDLNVPFLSHGICPECFDRLIAP